MTAEQDTERLARIYSAQARAYAEGWSPIIRVAGQRLLEALPWRGCARVLDVGTGAGEHLSDIRRLAPTAWVLGVDRSVGMLELARSRGVPLALMDAMDVSLRPETFDVAAMIFMLFHLDDPVAALRNVHHARRHELHFQVRPSDAQPILFRRQQHVREHRHRLPSLDHTDHALQG